MDFFFNSTTIFKADDIYSDRDSLRIIFHPDINILIVIIIYQDLTMLLAPITEDDMACLRRSISEDSAFSGGGACGGGEKDKDGKDRKGVKGWNALNEILCATRPGGST